MSPERAPQSLISICERQLNISEEKELPDIHRRRLVELFADEIDAKMRALVECVGRELQYIDLPERLRLIAHWGTSLNLNLHQLDEKGKYMKIVGQFIVDRLFDGMRITHREIQESGGYRKKGLGSVLLHATECFARHAPAKDTPRIVYANVGQKDLLDWLEKRGYKANDPEAVATMRADLAAGKLFVGAAGYIYVTGTPPEKQSKGFTTSQYRRRLEWRKTYSDVVTSQQYISC